MDQSMTLLPKNVLVGLQEEFSGTGPTDNCSDLASIEQDTTYSKGLSYFGCLL